MLYPILPFAEFVPSAPVIPKLYWDVKSQEQRWHRLCEIAKKLACYANELGIAINDDHEIIAQLLTDFEMFKKSGFNDYYAAQVEKWISDNLQKIIDAMAQKALYFGLTSDGYFCAYVPDSWREITFDTGMVFGRSDYGRLILEFEPDPNAQGVIDNRYQHSSFSLNSIDDIDAFIRDLEVNTRRTDNAYRTLYTNLDEEVSEGDF